MEQSSVYDYSEPIYRVLLEPNLFMGIGLMPFMFILIITIVLMNVVSAWCCIIGVLLLVVAKMLCKNDPQMLNILFDRLLLPRTWEAK